MENNANYNPNEWRPMPPSQPGQPKVYGNGFLVFSILSIFMGIGGLIEYLFFIRTAENANDQVIILIIAATISSFIILQAIGRALILLSEIRNAVTKKDN